jgi:hypothetical protein
MSATGQKIELFATDLAGSVGFYRHVLGFEVGLPRTLRARGKRLNRCRCGSVL